MFKVWSSLQDPWHPLKSLKTGMRPYEEISAGRNPALVEVRRMDQEGTRVGGTIRTAVLLWRPEMRSGGQGGEGGDVETWKEVRGIGKSRSWGQGDKSVWNECCFWLRG